MSGVANITGVIPKTTHLETRTHFVRSVMRGLGPVMMLAFIVLADAGCSSTGAGRQSKQEPGEVPGEFVRADYVRADFAAQRTSLIRVVVLPPQTEIARVTLWRTKTAHPGETSPVVERLKGLVEDQLRQLGFAVQSPFSKIAEAAVPATNEIAEARARLKQWMSSAPWGASRFDVNDEESSNLGPSAKVLADAAQADAVVCVRLWSAETTFARRMRGYHATLAGCVGAVAGTGGVLAAVYFSHGSFSSGGGEIGYLAVGAGVAGFFVFREVVWWITGGGSYEDSAAKSTTLQIAIVDGATGKVLWANTETVGSVGGNLDHLVARLFLNFPQ